MWGSGNVCSINLSYLLYYGAIAHALVGALGFSFAMVLELIWVSRLSEFIFL